METIDFRNDNLLDIKSDWPKYKQRKFVLRNWVYMSDEQAVAWENVNNYGYMVTGHMFDITAKEVEEEIQHQFGWE